MMSRSLPAVLAILLSFISGSSTSQPDADSPGENTGPVAHAVSSEKLKDIMHRLNQLTFEKELAPVQLREVREQHVQSLMATIDELLAAAEQLTDALPGFSLTPEEREIFIEMARRLKSEAYRIRYTAEVGSDREMDLAYQRLNHTCLACHRIFRF